MTPRATYRFQFHKGFTFAAAEALVPYLDRLGISHVYASPITTARSGSMHGYDVADPTRINPELGGEPAFRSLVAALRARGMGIIIDIVPNHMGVAGGENGWWNDVLAKGRASRYAHFFDIDWREKLMLPVLGDTLPEVLAAGDLALREEDGRFILVAYGEHRFPIRDEDQAGLSAGADADTIVALLDRQHYRLASWRTADADLNWRRFFTINDLAGLRAEDPAVFEASHALFFRLYGEGLIDGLRVDHVDGLTDPAGYCRRLRARLDGIARPEAAPPGPAYLVVEKILGPGEPRAQDWGVAGTSGYDFMEQVSAVLHDPAGVPPLTELWTRISGRSGDFADEELVARQEMLATAFRGQLDRCVEAFAALATSANDTGDCTPQALRDAIERMLWVFPVYRTYGTGGGAPARDAAIRATVRERVRPFLRTGEAAVVDAVLSWLAGEGPGDAALAAEAVRRFQQLSSPIAAKAVEDTAFYRYGRLLSRNDVGFDPAHLASSVATFHAQQTARADHFPHAMLATATHDHKRGEDVRARLAVLSALPGAWAERVAQWESMAAPFAEGTDPADRYMLYQTLFGAWPAGLSAHDGGGLSRFAERVKAWQEKSLREARLRSSWERPDEATEGRLKRLIDALLDPARSGAFLADLSGFVAWTAPAALANSLAQTALHLAVPGMPDLYQGCELADLSLVDPDNRTPVDYAVRERLVAASADAQPAKLALIRQLLDMRRSAPALFSDGAYRPLHCRGARSGNVIAFERSHAGVTLTCAVAIRCAAALVGGPRPTPEADWWADTEICADGGSVRAAELFRDAAVYVRLA
ncbi:malto-oligosyltrehalose synthase [Sphingomonas hengshuiensis]|uniref:Malto-oligosyltrehalose synthase n=1 Tax=Sphingomonas hengshuiensis TaxID=1609977 RepID=A0A7U4LE73_9SPHN|nr:malto-oligosyltrehalose synthase [Sphingomonas hengshuiensis]AJP71169.1 malto-oligosyltrehalose synthase [Sphingomonas hengshuiensis]